MVSATWMTSCKGDIRSLGEFETALGADWEPLRTAGGTTQSTWHGSSATKSHAWRLRSLNVEPTSSLISRPNGRRVTCPEKFMMRERAGRLDVLLAVVFWHRSIGDSMLSKCRHYWTPTYTTVPPWWGLKQDFTFEYAWLESCRRGREHGTVILLTFHFPCHPTLVRADI